MAEQESNQNDAKDQHDAKDLNGEKDKTCFVVIGFGMKTDHAAGRTLDLDLTYTKLIKPAFDNVKIRCFRAIDVNVSGSIDTLMYQWIYHADFVIADLSTMNANVFYELGVRHAQRPNTTLLMAENGLFKRLPFDLSHTIIYGYEHLGEDIANEEAERFVGLLSIQLEKLLYDPVKDSPVYTYLPGMKPPEWTDPEQLLAEQNQRIAELEEKLAAQEKLEKQIKEGAPSEINPEELQKQSLSILVQSAEAAKNKKDFPTAIALLKTAIQNDEDKQVGSDIFLWQRLALSTYKNKEGDDVDNEEAIDALKEAEKILIDHCELYVSTDPETLGLGGAINKRWWERTKDPAYHKKSLYHYERGYYIKQDYYNGINAAYMYTLKAAELAEKGVHVEAIVNYGHANIIRERVAEICRDLVQSKTFTSRGDKEWIYQTLATAYLGLGEPEKVEALFPKINEHSKGEFDLDTFHRYNQQLIDAIETYEKHIQLPGADGGRGSASSELPAVRQAPEGSISIDLGSHRGQSVKSVEVNCRVEFE